MFELGCAFRSAELMTSTGDAEFVRVRSLRRVPMTMTSWGVLSAADAGAGGGAAPEPAACADAGPVCIAMASAPSEIKLMCFILNPFVNVKCLF